MQNRNICGTFVRIFLSLNELATTKHLEPCLALGGASVLTLIRAYYSGLQTSTWITDFLEDRGLEMFSNPPPPPAQN